MTRTHEENARDAMHEEELREAAQAVIARLPRLVPAQQMDYDRWLSWAADELRTNQGQYDDEYLPFMHEAVETAIFNRNAMNPWPDFTRALQNCLPEMPADAVVYEVDSDDGGGDVDCPNTVLSAARLVGGRIAGVIYTRAVSKEWLREFCLADEIEQAKSGISNDHLKAAEAAGWRVGHDPQNSVPDVVLIHDELERIWPLDDVAGAMADIGMPLDTDTETPEP